MRKRVMRTVQTIPEDGHTKIIFSNIFNADKFSFVRHNKIILIKIHIIIIRNRDKKIMPQDFLIKVQTVSRNFGRSYERHLSWSRKKRIILILSDFGLIIRSTITKREADIIN